MRREEVRAHAATSATGPAEEAENSPSGASTTPLSPVYPQGQRSTGATSSTHTLILFQLGLEGTDSAAFSVSTGTSTTDGFEQAEIISTARPLPSGEYSFDIKESWPEDKPCNYVVSNEVTVSVTARGALHEFFFDPVTVGSTVAADSTNGVLRPASFTGANGATTTISSLTWEPSSTISGTVSRAGETPAHIRSRP